jgi:hypothetical protein
MEQAMGVTSATAAAAAAQQGRPRSRADRQQRRSKEMLGPLQLPLQPRADAVAGAAAAAAAGGTASSSSQVDLDDAIKHLQVGATR